MIIKYLQLSVLIPLLISTACSGELSLKVEFDGSDIEIKCPDGKGFYLTEADTAYIFLEKWFVENKSEWKESPLSYLPEIIVSSSDAEINIMKSTIIVNQNSSQFVKEYTGEIQNLFCQANY